MEKRHEMPKCSKEEHKNINSISYCQDCKIYMCLNCEKFHAELFKNHHQFKTEKEQDIKEIFTGLCTTNNHNIELQFYCKTHNVLCCSKCITKLKDTTIGQHSDCNVCYIEKFEEEKKSKLTENIKSLEALLNTLNQTIDELKKETEKLKNNNEELKTCIKTKFIKLRKAINDKEIELMEIIDKRFNKNFLERTMQKVENLPEKTKKLLEKVKSYEYNWKNNKLNLLINDCINVENIIIEINRINDINKFLKKKIH